MGAVTQLAVELPEGMPAEDAAEDIMDMLNGMGYDTAPMGRDKKKEPGWKNKEFMEGVYREIDGGKTLQEILDERGMKYSALYARHKRYQDTLPEGERRPMMIEPYVPPAKEVFMDWVYAQLEKGMSVAEIAKEAGLSTRTIYARLRKDMPGRLGRVEELPETVQRRLVKASTRKTACRKPVRMEEVYENLMSGMKVGTAAQSAGVSYPTLERYHRLYQEAHKGETGRYIREKLTDFKTEEGA